MSRKKSDFNKISEKLANQENKIDLKSLAEKWPSTIVARTEISRITGGAISEKYAANLDSQGLFVEGRFKLGRKVVYPIASLIAWLESRATRLN